MLEYYVLYHSIIPLCIQFSPLFLSVISLWLLTLSESFNDVLPSNVCVGPSWFFDFTLLVPAMDFSINTTFDRQV